ncbi:hypothetical protein PIB30_090495 [Stylosanthes scabra]|uniref:Uncharacterized protein n=1 Tax=Stylosanthes scabra TaxID=79078 RepID=A0ABU6VTG4_9FABA|nr:hypothetical protein [Stylosanthes scabra]
MAFSSKRRRAGKQVVTDEEFDVQRFKTAFHQQFYNSYVASKDIIPDTTFNLEEGEFLEIEQQIELRGWKRLAKPKLKVGQSIIREFYANARINEYADEEQPHFQTFVRGSTWELGARNNPLYLKRRDLRALARGCGSNDDRNCQKPPHNKASIGVPKCYCSPMRGCGGCYRAPNSNEAVPKIIPITAAVMENIRYPYHQPPLPPPQPQQYVGEGGHQEQPTYDAQMPQGYGWGQLQADMANLRISQTEFYESILAQNASYGLCLREIEVKQNDMWAEQNQFYKDVRAYQEQQKEYQKLQQEQFQQIQAEQAQIHKEFTNYKNFSTHMGKINKNFEDQRTEMGNINHNLLSHTVSSKAKSYYTCWGLQQMNPSLAPVPPTSITILIQNNVQENKPMFDGMLCPWPVGEPSTGDKGKAPIDKDALRDPNAESDNE